MASKLGVQYPGAVYHVLNRGDRREPIFQADADRALFLDTLAQACAKTRWQVHAYLQLDAGYRYKQYIWENDYKRKIHP